MPRTDAAAAGGGQDRATAPGRVRRDPRVVQTERAVFAATFQLIERFGPGDVTIEQIAAASGVARSTIYRRWADVDELFLQAIEALTRLRDAPAPTGDLRADLEAFATAYAAELNDPTFFAVVLFLMDASLRSPAYLACYREITQARARRVARAVRAARAADATLPRIDADELADVVMAPLFQARVGLHRLVTVDDVASAVDWAVASVAPVRRPARRR